jgi:uncharacterized RDD family membrane protein YckC
MLVDPPTQRVETRLVEDPANSYDASEEQFAASLQRKLSPRFVVEEDGRTAKRDSEPHPGASQPRPADDISVAEASLNRAAGPATSRQADLLPSDGAWRQEVTAKLSRYRARRRVLTPRYPSLQLRLEVPEAPSEEQPATPPPTPNRLALAVQEVASESETPTVEAPAPAASETGEGAKILEFPRFFSAPRPVLDELAEPVFDQPRILEVPEQLPPPPALGGILIEPEEKVEAERRPGFELPLNPPPMARRMAAGVIDLSIVSISFAAFAVMFFRVTHVVPPLRQAAGVCAGMVAAVWFVYQYLFLVYPGITPGLKLIKLQLSRFDGTPAPRSLRRWRVLASVLSGLSLALGYVWCFFDEDQLCWHDRITHTYMASVPPAPPGATAPKVP